MQTFMDFVAWASGLSAPIKIIVSLIIVLAGVVLISLLWFPTAGTSTTLWPQEKSVEALKRRISATSPTNRAVVRLILAAGPDGVYLSRLMEQANLTRRETIDRCKELANADLIVERDFTDKRYEIHGEIWRVLGTHEPESLRTLLDGNPPQPTN